MELLTLLAYNLENYFPKKVAYYWLNSHLDIMFRVYTNSPHFMDKICDDNKNEIV